MRIFLLLVLLITSVNEAANDEVLKEPGYEEVVVTAHREPRGLQNVTADTTVLTREDFESSSARNLADILNRVQGVHTVRQGGHGSLVSVFTRGGDSGFTQILLDGVELNDPSSPNRAALLDHISLEQIERIEIVRGPQSGVYGSDSMAGVIQIFTKKPKLNQLESQINLGWDELDTQKFSYQVSRKTALGSLLFNYSQIDTDGISAADAIDGNTEKDGYKNRQFRFHMTQNLDENLELQIQHYQVYANLQYDSGAPVDQDLTASTRQAISKIGFTKNHSDGLEKFLYSRHLIDRVSPNDFRGEVRQLQWNRQFSFENHNFLIGVENQWDEAYTDFITSNKQHSQSVFLQNSWQANERSLWINSLRWDNHAMGGSNITYRSGLNWTMGANRFLLASSSGFQAPSLLQASNPVFSRQLEAQKSRSFEAAWSRKLFGKFDFKASWFSNRYVNLIDYTSQEPGPYFNGGYKNISRSRSHGVELAVAFDAGLDWRFNFQSTFLNTLNLDDNTELLRRPGEIHRIFVDHKLSDKSNLGIEWEYRGRAADLDGFDPGFLPSCELTHLSYRHAVDQKRTLFVKLENVFDKQYQRILNYGAPGRLLRLEYQVKF